MLQLFLLTFITGIRVVVLMFRCIQDIVETLIGYCKSFSRHSTFQINENVVSLQCCILSTDVSDDRFVSSLTLRPVTCLGGGTTRWSSRWTGTAARATSVTTWS
mgnify:CR=1 FL=1